MIKYHLYRTITDNLTRILYSFNYLIPSIYTSFSEPHWCRIIPLPINRFSSSFPNYIIRPFPLCYCPKLLNYALLSRAVLWRLHLRPKSSSMIRLHFKSKTSLSKKLKLSLITHKTLVPTPTLSLSPIPPAICITLIPTPLLLQEISQ